MKQLTVCEDKFCEENYYVVYIIWVIITILTSLYEENTPIKNGIIDSIRNIYKKYLAYEHKTLRQPHWNTEKGLTVNMTKIQWF